MKIQNNVNYNSNPAFRSGRLVLKGSNEAIEKFARALKGGFISQQGEESIRIVKEFPISLNPAQVTMERPNFVAMEKDADSFVQHLVDNDLGPSFRIRMHDPKEVNRVYRAFFKGADEIDLKLLRFVVEGATAAVKRFTSALKGGLAAQDVPLVNDYHPKKTLIAIGEDAAVWSNKVEWFRECGGRADSGYNELVDEFFKNAQVIHVTE